MKYDPYAKRYISKEDYIKECYGGNESMLEEQWNALPDHPGYVDIVIKKYNQYYEEAKRVGEFDPVKEQECVRVCIALKELRDEIIEISIRS